MSGLRVDEVLLFVRAVGKVAQKVGSPQVAKGDVNVCARPVDCCPAYM